MNHFVPMSVTLFLVQSAVFSQHCTQQHRCLSSAVQLVQCSGGSAVQCSAVKCSAVQKSVMQCSVVQCRYRQRVQQCGASESISGVSLQGGALHCCYCTALLYCIVALHCCTVLLYCIVALHCSTALHCCTALLYCTVVLYCCTVLLYCIVALRCALHCALYIVIWTVHWTISVDLCSRGVWWGDKDTPRKTRDFTIPHCTALHCTALHCPVQNWSKEHCNKLYTALHSTTLHYTSMNFTALPLTSARYCSPDQDKGLSAQMLSSLLPNFSMALLHILVSHHLTIQLLASIALFIFDCLLFTVGWPAKASLTTRHWQSSIALVLALFTVYCLLFTVNCYVGHPH